MVVVGLWICISLVIVAILAIAISGVRGLVNGEVNSRQIGTFALPVVLWVIILLISGSWVTAGIATMLIMVALMILAIVLSGIKGLFI